MAPYQVKAEWDEEASVWVASSEVYPLLVGICVQDARYRSAASYSEEYLHRHPSDQRLRFVLASLYAGIGENELAKRALEDVLRAEPAHADAHYALGMLLHDGDRDFEAADAHFRAYLKLRPQGVHAEEAVVAGGDGRRQELALVAPERGAGVVLDEQLVGKRTQGDPDPWPEAHRHADPRDVGKASHDRVLHRALDALVISCHWHAPPDRSIPSCEVSSGTVTPAGAPVPTVRTRRHP